MKRFSLILGCVILVLPQVSPAQSTEPVPLDLPTVLRLTKAHNLDIQIAREKLKEAKANHVGAISQFFPWLAPGIVYRRHDDAIQTVDGQIIDVRKQSYAPGVSVAAQVDAGEALYKTLAAKQQIYAAEQGLAAQRQESTLAGIQDYFALLLAQASVGVAREAVRISADQQEQVIQAVAAGLIFKGDELRVRTQTERNRLALRQALEQKRTAAARLAQTLQLDPALDLAGTDSELAPLALFNQKKSLNSLVSEARAARPELQQSSSLVLSARATKTGATYGPLIPSISAQTFFGGLGGESDAGPSRFNRQEDYFVGLSWRIGPGGLFDFGRTRAAEAHLRIAELSAQKLDTEISRQVVNAFARFQSLRDQIDSTKRILATAEEGLRLAQLRKEFAVGVVLENIQAEQDLTRARFDYFKAVADFNSAQYALSRALGAL